MEGNETGRNLAAGVRQFKLRKPLTGRFSGDSFVTYGHAAR
jgi:hypothetical protein